MSQLHGVVDHLLAHLEEVIPRVASKTYDEVKRKIKVDVDEIKSEFSKTNGIEKIVSMLMDLLILLRTWKDKITFGLCIARMLTTNGVVRNLVEWVVDFISQKMTFPNDDDLCDSDTIPEDVDGFVVDENVASTSRMRAESIPSALSAIMVLLHVIVFQSKPCLKQLGQFLFDVGRVPVAVRGMEQLVVSFRFALENFKRWTSRVIYGVDAIQYEEEVDPFILWSEEVDELYRSVDRKNMDWTIEKVDAFDKLYDRALAMRRNTQWMDVNPSVRSTFNTRFAVLQKLFDEIASCGARQLARVEPYMFYLWGESGMGKSLITPLVALEYLSRFEKEELERNGYDHIACTYTRKSGDPRWDGVSSQKVYIYDDYGQMLDTPTNPSTELLETIELANSAPFNPLMAACEKKGRVQLAPKFIVHTSNIICPEIYSLAKPVAVARRFDAIYEIVSIPEVMTNGAIDQRKVELFKTTQACVCDTGCDICLCVTRYQKYEVRQNMVGQEMKFRHDKIGRPIAYDEMMTATMAHIATKRDQRKGRKDYFIRKAKELCMRAQVGDDNITPDEVGEEPEIRVENTFTHEDGFQLPDQDNDPDLAYTNDLNLDIIAKEIPKKLQWLRTKLAEGLELVKQAWTRKTLVKTLLAAIGIVVSISGLYHVYHKETVAHEDFIKYSQKVNKYIKDNGLKQVHTENDDSLSKMYARRSNKQSARGENDDSLSKMYARRSNKTSARGETLDDKKVRDQFTPKELESVHLFSEGMTDPQLDAVMKKVYRQMYHIRLMDGCAAGAGVVVAGRIFLTFRHVLARMRDGFVLINAQTKIEYNCKEVLNVIPYEEKSDVCLMELPKIVPVGADIVKLIVKEEDVLNHTFIEARLMSIAGGLNRIHYGVAQGFDRVMKYDGPLDMIAQRNYYEYCFDTKPGYCGSILFRQDKSCSAKIVGMHVAGGYTESYCIAAAICRERIEEMIKTFGLRSQCALPLDVYKADTKHVDTKYVALGGIGRVTSGVTDPYESKITPSPMYGWDGEPIKKPAMLSGIIDGVHVRDKAREKLKQNQVHQVNKTNLNLASAIVSHNVEAAAEGVDRSVWTLEQSAFGDDKFSYCDAVDMDTSSGMPWKNFAGRKKGKKAFLNKTTRFIRDDLRDACNERSEAAQNNERVTTIWSDHYKDECRLASTGKWKKPRLFSGAPLDYTLVVRQFFGAFCAAVMKGRIRNGVAVGINPFGAEWGFLAQHLATYSDDIFCGDFSNFDGSLHSEVLWKVCEMINLWYDDEHNNVREVLFEDIVNAVHLSQNQMYVMDHGNPSGNPLTAILNSLYQLVALNYVLLQQGISVADLRRKFTFVTYGDDNICAVNGGIKTLELEKLTEGFKTELNMILTSSDKTGQISYIKIEEADFLSRSFRCEDGVWYGGRPWENLSLVFNWRKSSESWTELVRSYSECCYYELSQKSKEDFVKYSQKINKYIRDNGWTGAPLFEMEYYRDALRQWNGQDFLIPFCWGI